MLGGLFIVILSGFVSFAVISSLKRKHPFIDAVLLQRLFFYHLFLTLAYYLYVLTSPSDSRYYYQKVEYDYRGDTWADFYGTSTTFIEWVGYPFIKYMGFSYEAIMALFSLFGFLGFLYFYVFFRENIRFRHTFMNFNLVTLFFFLPNLHFWSASFGKGALIFLGLGLYFYGISRFKARILAVIIGGVIIYHVRPHIMLVVLVSSALGFVFTTKGVGIGWRVLFLSCAAVAFFFIYQDVLKLVGVDEDQPITQGLDLTHRASELSKATSGVDIASYSLPEQIFTFLYRPLFFDAPGLLGIIVSFENVFYLVLTLMFLFNMRSYGFLLRANFLVKSALFSFITVTVALAQVSGNLGLAMRQKSQVMILFLFVIISFLEEQKIFEWRAQQKRREMKERIRQRLAGGFSNTP